MDSLELLRLEEYVFQIGSWHSLDELEDSVTLEELHRLFVSQQRRDHQQRQFAAALKGIEIDPFDDPDNKEATSFEDVQDRAKKRREEFLGIAPSAGSEDGIGSMFDLGEVM